MQASGDTHLVPASEGACCAALCAPCRDYGKLLESKGEPPVTVRQCKTLKELLGLSDVSRAEWALVCVRRGGHCKG